MGVGVGWEILLKNNKVFWLESYLLFVYLLGWFPWTLENWSAEGKYPVQGLTVNWGQDLAWHPGPLTLVLVILLLPYPQGDFWTARAVQLWRRLLGFSLDG